MACVDGQLRRQFADFAARYGSLPTLQDAADDSPYGTHVLTGFVAASWRPKPLAGLKELLTSAAATGLPQPPQGSAGADEGYCRALACLGPTLLDALNGGLHSLRLGSQGPGTWPPVLSVHSIAATSAELHCHSLQQDSGLQYVVEGWVVALARRFYQCEVALRPLRGREDGTCDHEVYQLTFPCHHDVFLAPRTRLRERAMASWFAPTPELFYCMFPFHFILDAGCNLIQVGSKLLDLIPCMAPGTPISDIFKIRHPDAAAWNFAALLDLTASCFLLVSMRGGTTGLRLQGQFTLAHMEGQHVLLFMGSPRLSGLEEMQSYGLFLSDLPPLDAARDLVLIEEQCQQQAQLAQRREETKVADHQMGQAMSRREHDMERTEAENERLRAILAEILSNGPSDATVDLDTPADKALNLINKILCGEEVTVHEAMEARRALTAGGSDLRRPVNFGKQMSLKSGLHDEVNQALVSLLVNHNATEWEDEPDSPCVSASGRQGSLESEWNSIGDTQMTSSFSLDHPMDAEAAGNAAAGAASAPGPCVPGRLLTTCPEFSFPHLQTSSSAGCLDVELVAQRSVGGGLAAAPALSPGSSHSPPAAGSSSLPRHSSLHHLKRVSLLAGNGAGEGRDGGDSNTCGGSSGSSPSHARSGAQRSASVLALRPASEEHGESCDMRAVITAEPHWVGPGGAPQAAGRGSPSSAASSPMRATVHGCSCSSSQAATGRAAPGPPSSPASPPVSTSLPLLTLPRLSPSPLAPGSPHANPTPTSPSWVSRTPSPAPGLSPKSRSNPLPRDLVATAPWALALPQVPALSAPPGSGHASAPCAVGVGGGGGGGDGCEPEPQWHQDLDEAEGGGLGAAGCGGSWGSLGQGRGSPSGGRGRFVFPAGGSSSGVGAHAARAMPSHTYLTRTHQRSVEDVPAHAGGGGAARLGTHVGRRASGGTDSRVQLLLLLKQTDAVPLPAAAATAAAAAAATATTAAAAAPAGAPRSQSRPIPWHGRHEGGGAATLTRAPRDELGLLLAKIDDWQYDTFALHSASHGHSLSVLSFALIKRTEAFRKYHMDAAKLARFVIEVEQGYQSHDYHCSIHAADVLRTLHVMVTRGGVWQGTGCSEVGMLGSYLAALVHDYDHRGVNNDFLVKTQDDLALQYNDRRPMENFHAASTWIMLKNHRLNFLGKRMPQKARDYVRNLVVDMILATDMKQHFSLTSLFSSKVASVRPGTASTRPGTPSIRPGTATNRPGIFSRPVTPDPALANGAPCGTEAASPSELPLELPVLVSFDEETRHLALQMALKWADLGHLASPLHVHERWVQRLEEEMFRQGDRERALGLAVSPLMNRAKGHGITKSQTGFFNFVAIPMYQNMVAAFPGCGPILAAVQANCAVWAKREKTMLM